MKLKQVTMTIEELCRKHGISTATYYNWKDKCAGMTLADIKRLKQLSTQTKIIQH